MIRAKEASPALDNVRQTAPTGTGGREARTVTASADAEPAAILGQLGLTTGPPVILVGGTWPPGPSASTDLVARAVADVALDLAATVVDAGPSAIGQAVAEAVAKRGGETPVVAVALYSGIETGSDRMRAGYSHVVLVRPPEVSTEQRAVGMVSDLAAAIADGAPGAVILLGGDGGDEWLSDTASGPGWPVLVVEDADGLGERGAREVATSRRPHRDASADPRASALLAGRRVFLFPSEHSWEAFGRILHRLLQPLDSALKWAWTQFAIYDYNAGRLHRAFEELQLTILAVGVSATLLALTQSTLLAHRVVHPGSSTAHALHYTVLVLPIALAALLGVAARFRSGNKWVDLRSGAEGIKREIFRYRTRTGHYGARKGTRFSRDEVLTQQVAAISRALMQTEVNRTLLREPPLMEIPPKMHRARSMDDGFSDLSPEQYLVHRVQDQIDYYRTRARRLEQQVRLLQGMIFLIGGVGTLIAALHVDVWIALTTAIVAAITTYLGYEQVESTLINYNQASSGLVSLKGWWEGLSPDAQASPEQWDRLVGQSERILQREQGGWVQEMTDALAELQAEQARQDEPPAPRRRGSRRP